MKISVIIPTHNRPKELEKCLQGLKNQERQADEIIVVYRNQDIITKKFLIKKKKEITSLKIVKVNVPGQVAALNKGLDTAKGDIISFTDDDAVPNINWLKRIESNFLLEETISGVGGKDIVHNKVNEKSKKTVGKLKWYGKIVGNHHLGFGKEREVDILKGVNMSFRKKAIERLNFDEGLLGKGAQVHNELSVCLSIKKAGWKLLYNPAIIVDHFPSQRFDEDNRNHFNKTAYSNAVHNETLAILDYFQFHQRIIFILWAILIGTKGAFGLLQLFRFLPEERKLALEKYLASMKGRWLGYKTWKKDENTSNRQVLS